jgi:DNA primase
MRYQVNAETVKRRMRGRWKIIYENFVNELSDGRKKWVQGLCPFHNDSDPSFSFNKQHGGWKCFSGCGSGDPFEFIERIKGSSFAEAVQKIATMGGVV